MIVSELIQKLESLPPSLEVVVYMPDVLEGYYTTESAYTEYEEETEPQYFVIVGDVYGAWKDEV